MEETGTYYFTGEGIEHRREVLDVKAALRKVGIFLEGFKIRITGVYARPRPIGFDFDCADPAGLRALAQSRSALGEDNQDTLEGKFVASQADGDSFRQIGAGPSLHLEIHPHGKCNVHIDSHGLVVGRDGNRNVYDYNLALEHGYWDLLSDTVPGLFGAFGDRGVVGPMARPMLGVDGKMRFVFGLTGRW